MGERTGTWMNKKYSKSDQLKKLHEKRKRQTNEALNAAITQLSLENEEISIATVSRKANVSRKTIYNRPNTLERIRLLQGQQANCRFDNDKVKEKREKKIIESYERKLKKAYLEIDDLKKELEKLRTLYYRAQY